MTTEAPPYPAWLTPAHRAVYIACAHISNRTMADATSAECRAVSDDAHVGATYERLNHCALSGDVPGTQAAAQAYNAALRAALKRIRETTRG
jgi:hypothetical protein